MKITILPSDMDAAGFYRVLSPARQLALHGHSVAMPEYTQAPNDTGSVNTTFSIDLDNPQGDLWVLQQRKERMWAEGGIHTLRERGIATVADIDDNYLETPPWNPSYYGAHPYKRDDGVIINREMRRKSLPKYAQKATNKLNRNHMHEVFKQVDALTVSTPYLKQLYETINGDITVIRNYVDWDMWEDLTPVYEQEHDRIRIGYLGVWSYRRGDLEVIKRVIRPFMEKHPQVDFVANSAEVHDFLDVPSGRRITVPEWHFYPQGDSDYPLPRKTAVMDIGLVPLAPGGMAEGKSHLKGMEYNAAGIPFVASNTESYRYWTKNGGNGWIADTEKDFSYYLTALVENPDVRRKMGEFGRLRAQDHSIQANWPEYLHVYERVLGDDLTAYSRGAIRRGAVQKVSELRSLLELASTRDLKVVVEVGSARGGTFWALSQVAREDALLVSIDIPSGSPLDVREGKDVYTGRDRERFRSFVKETQRCVLIDGNSQLLATLEKLVDTIGSQKIDLLFIDADHRYEGVKRDFELYSPLVREGGIIAFHDVIRQNDLRSGVHILWAELRKKYDRTLEWVGRDDWGLGNWGGIGAIEV